jgi:hypothetical protein
VRFHLLICLSITFWIISCSKPKFYWTSKALPPEERALLFSTFGSSSLDPSLAKVDLIWGQNIRNFEGYSSIRKEEFVLATCRLPLLKVITDYGNLSTKDHEKGCHDQSAFDEVFLSKLEGGATIEDALLIPFSSARYIVNDSVSPKMQFRWYRIDVPRLGKLAIRLNSSESLTGKLYRDRNENRRFEFEELAEALRFEEESKTITVNVDKSPYYFVIEYEGDEIKYELDFKSTVFEGPVDKGANHPSESLALEASETENLVSDSLNEFDQVDYFGFKLDEAASLKINLKRVGGEGDADVALYHDLNEDGQLSDEELIIVSEASGDESIGLPQAAQGKWYLKTSLFRGSLHYSLTLQAIKTVSSDLFLSVKKEKHQLKISVKNLGPSAADQVSLVVKCKEDSKIIFQLPQWTKLDPETYIYNFHHIAVNDEETVVLEGESDEIVTFEVLSKGVDPNHSNNAAAILF